MSSRGKSVLATQATLSATKRAADRAQPPRRGAARSKIKPLAMADDITDEMFEVAADTFRIMSAPLRLRIINSLCESEKFVGQLLEEIPTTQPNMSQHLNALFKAKILGRRRKGVQIYYRLINDQVVTICRAMCQHVAALDDPLKGDAASG